MTDKTASLPSTLASLSALLLNPVCACAQPYYHDLKMGMISQLQGRLGTN